ncbi:MAG: matrixin family metalloprotease [Desulfatibacillaceae bacterium]|nr:matrixin family metalloprotease [Desulfatibacillaceae bacterium]
MSAFFWLFFAASVFAGGPLGVIGNGRFERWDSQSPLRYRVDPGPLGAFTNEQARAMVAQAFARWTSIETSSLPVEYAGLLGQDITVANYRPYLYEPYSGMVIIFDHDGSIVEDVKGLGAKNSVLGFASPLFADENGFYTCGFIVLNGTKASSAAFAQTITHEIGHMLGLDHTPLYNSNRRQDTPVMYPIYYTEATPDPKPDDRAWFSWLYPDQNSNATTGRITGGTFRRSLLPFHGAVVVAQKVEEDINGNWQIIHGHRVACIADFLKQGFGRYELPFLEPGHYEVYMETLGTTFYGGSSIGPFNLWFMDFPRDYYNAQNESGDPAVDDPTQKVILLVEAGDNRQDINLVSNNPPPGTGPDPLSDLTDDDSVIYEFPGGFSFPFQGREFGYCMVNSDGNLTFLDADRASAARDAARMIEGPPRIAPLLTDLNPAAAGSVITSAGPGSFSFIWSGVPEYSPTPVRGNTFAVTLYASGDVAFDYTSVTVTPDPDGILAVVGVAPGYFGQQSGPQTQFTQDPYKTYVIGDEPLYQVFAQDFGLAGYRLFFGADEDSQGDGGKLPLPAQAAAGSGSGGACFIRSILHQGQKDNPPAPGSAENSAIFSEWYASFIFNLFALSRIKKYPKRSF